jgi:uncharacterized protein YjbI with pentapeptide repeats
MSLRRWLGVGIAAIAAFVAVSYVALKLSPDWFAETHDLDAKGRADARQGVRTATLALFAGMIAVVGAVYTARTFALNRAGQLTDRFTKAIEQLGHAELDVRLGGIYALERIARDSREDHPQVVEVLNAYVREHAPRRNQAAAGLPVPPPGLPTDVQAVLTVLGRRKTEHDRSDGPRIDLSGTALTWADLSAANFGGANFNGAELIGANFSGAVLRGAAFGGAGLGNARLVGADLSGAYLSRATLVEAKLSGADLTEADLREASLPGAHLDGADLRRADLSGAFLDSAFLSGQALLDIGVSPMEGGNARLDGAKYDGRTTWPDGFDPKAAGARFVTPPPRLRPKGDGAA